MARRPSAKRIRSVHGTAWPGCSARRGQVGPDPLLYPRARRRSGGFRRRISMSGRPRPAARRRAGVAQADPPVVADGHEHEGVNAAGERLALGTELGVNAAAAAFAEEQAGPVALGEPPLAAFQLKERHADEVRLGLPALALDPLALGVGDVDGVFPAAVATGRGSPNSGRPATRARAVAWEPLRKNRAALGGNSDPAILHAGDCPGTSVALGPSNSVQPNWSADEYKVMWPKVREFVLRVDRRRVTTW